MMLRSIALVALIALTSQGQTISLPARSEGAKSGPAFFEAIKDLPLQEREERVIAEFKCGNIPDFFRKFQDIGVVENGHRLKYQVSPDYVAIGSNQDYRLIPLTPASAEKIAQSVGCSLPTTKMVDQIFDTAEVKLTPSPIPPSPKMTTISVFAAHAQTIAQQRAGRSLGSLTAGHKKDVVICRSVTENCGKVAIYGWHKPDHKPIQPLYTGHIASWVDYSHGIRLVHDRMELDGKPISYAEILKDPNLAGLLSAEGVLKASHYQKATDLRPAQGELYESLSLENGVKIVINRPEILLADRPMLRVIYALPNGNTIDQTIGKITKPGDDWHFDIQHIGAQTRFLRSVISDRQVVIAYVGNDMKAWPAWRRKNGDRQIPQMIDNLMTRYGKYRPKLVLNGHSGGGSFIFGYINEQEMIPDFVERVGFLDSNYAYETERHRDKLLAWLKNSQTRFLSLVAYHDSVALLNGKTFVSASGGTWGRSLAMLRDFESSTPLVRSRNGDLETVTAFDGRLQLRLLENPEQKIFHTVMVEKNGFIESMLSGTKLQGEGYEYLGGRCYSALIVED